MKTSTPPNKQPKPIADTVDEPDIKDLVITRMKAMRDARELKDTSKYKLLLFKQCRFSNFIYLSVDSNKQN